ncbi:tripartite motif-containing protein 2-like [Ptychodera flava]|uniref:tripartite motif-containing protein 2-like n=1 Tax=Ptychodera flava TaxID=63121 RepID=UPI003969F2BC
MRKLYRACTVSVNRVSVAEYYATMSSDPASLEPLIYCNTHPEYPKAFYCDTCNTTICLKCTALDHPLTGHKYRSIEDAAIDFTRQLSAIIDKVKMKEKQFIEGRSTTEEVLECLDECYQRDEENLREHIDRTVVKVTQLIKENGEKLLAELKYEYDKKTENLTTQLRELDKDGNYLTSVCEYLENLLHYGNASQLVSAKKAIEKQTEELVEVKSRVEPMDNDCIKFQPCDDFCQDKCLGAISVQPVYQLSEIPTIVRVDEEIAVKLLNTDNSIWNKSNELQNVKIEAVLKPPDDSTQELEVVGEEGGILTLKTRVKIQGVHELSVAVSQKPVHGSPVRIKVIPKKRLVCQFWEKGLGIGLIGCIQGITMMRNGDVLVCEYSNQRLQSFTVKGILRKMFDFAGVHTFHPSDATISVDGNILTTDSGSNQVIVCDENGNVVRCFGKGKFRYPIGIANNYFNGRVYVVDNWAHCIHIYDKGGNHIKSFGGFGNRNGQFSYPTFVCIDNTGNVFVSDSGNHRIQVFNGDGHFLYTFGSEGNGDGELDYPKGVAVDKHGHVYVADCNNARVVKYESRGKYVCNVDDASDVLNSPMSVCVADNGTVIVGDQKGNCIKVFALS